MGRVISDEDRAFVRQCGESFMTLGPHFAPLKEEAWDPRGPGVPPEMAMTEPDEEGLVAWKVLPSEVTDRELALVEGRLPHPLPPLFRAYLTTLYILRLAFGDVVLPHVPSDNPLGEFQDTTQRWSSLQDAGYVAFAEGRRGPLCFDVRLAREDGDCPVVLFDRDALLELGRDQWDQRLLLASCGQHIAVSFRALLVDCFLKRAPQRDPAQA